MTGEIGQSQNIRNGWKEDSKVAEEGFEMVAGATTDAIGDFTAFVFNFLELGFMRLIHA